MLRKSDINQRSMMYGDMRHEDGNTNIGSVLSTPDMQKCKDHIKMKDCGPQNQSPI